MTTFTQLTARLKNFLMGWLLVLSLNDGLVECATVCVKSEVILLYLVPLPPYFRVGKEVESVSIYIRGWRDVRTQPEPDNHSRNERGMRVNIINFLNRFSL